MVLALVGAFAFADGPTMTWKTNMYSGFGIAATNGATTIAGYDYSWVGAGAVRFNMNYTAADGNAGFNSRLQMTMPDPSIGAGAFGGPAALFNQINAWAKFFGGAFTVRAGMNDDYTIATPIWNTYGTTDGKVGIYFDIAPVAGLDIGYFQPIPNSITDAGQILSPLGSGRAILGAAYSAKDLGKVEVGYIVADTTLPKTTNAQIYFGGNLSAVKGLTVQLEGIADLPTSGSGPIVLLENVSYNMGALTVGSYVGESINGSTFDWGLEPTASYKVNDNLSVNAILNVYSNPSQTWMSPIDAGAIFGGVAGTVNFAGGLSLGYAMSGATLTVGDYYTAATDGGNLVYVNLDLAL